MRTLSALGVNCAADCLQAVDLAAQHGVDIGTFRPHSSHLAQPRDVGCMFKLKGEYSLRVSSWKLEAPGKGRDRKRTCARDSRAAGHHEAHSLERGLFGRDDEERVRESGLLRGGELRASGSVGLVVFASAYGPARIRVLEYGLKQNTEASRNGAGGGACADAALWLDVVEIMQND